MLPFCSYYFIFNRGNVIMNRIIRGIILSLFFILLLNPLALASVGIEDEVKAYLLGDFETGEILEGYNAYQPIEIASISKLMSYLIVMEHVDRGEIGLDDKVYIDDDVTRIKGSSLELKEGEVFTVRQLLEASLVVSANDATYALAKYVAGSEEEFVKRMNYRAQSLGLESAYFINSTGLPQGEEQNKMSTKDIFELSRYIIREFPETLTFTSISNIHLENRDYDRENTNPLLKEIKGVDGLKTGFTNKAGYCLVATINIKGDNVETEDFRLISIIMGSGNEEKRKELSKELIEYGLNNYTRRIIAKENMPVDLIYLPSSKNEVIEVYPTRNFTITVRKGDSIHREVLVNEDISLPLKSMEKIGRLNILLNGEILDQIDLVVHQDVEKANIFIRIYRYVKRIIGKIIEKLLTIAVNDSDVLTIIKKSCKI